MLDGDFQNRDRAEEETCSGLEKGIPFSLTLGRDGAETPRARIGIAKGRWRFPKDWEKLDKKLDKQIEDDFYEGSF